jgi:hypothetical protein
VPFFYGGCVRTWLIEASLIAMQVGGIVLTSLSVVAIRDGFGQHTMTEMPHAALYNVGTHLHLTQP